MRIGRMFNAGRNQPPLNFAPLSVFKRPVMAASLYEDQKYAKRLGNQLNYWNEAYSYDGKPAPSFYGYEGMGVDAATKHTGFAAAINFRTFTNPIFVARPEDPHVKVWLVNEEKWPTEEEPAPEETPRTGEYNEHLQLSFNSVPMPDPAKVLFGGLASIGSDGGFGLWDPIGHKMWEMHRLSKFKTGIHSGEWKCGFGSANDTSTWNCIGISANGGNSASFLCLAAGDISIQDLVEVLRGGKIKHALGIAVRATASTHFAPAIANDNFGNSPAEYENVKKEKVINPANGKVDEIPEGSWFRFPPASRASDYGLTGKLEAAIYEAIREYGLVVTDHSGEATMSVEAYQALGSPYSYSKVNPFVGNTSQAIFTTINETLPPSWTDPTLPKFTEELGGTGSCVFKLWQKTGGTFEQIAPFSS